MKLPDIAAAGVGAALALGAILFFFGNVFAPQWVCEQIPVTTTQCDSAAGAR